MACLGLSYSQIAPCVRCVRAKSLTHVRFCETSGTAACQAPLSTGFSRQGYWSGLPLPSLGDLPNPGVEPAPLTSPALASGSFTTSATWEARSVPCCCCCHFSRVRLCTTPETAAHQAPPSLGFSRQEHWRGLPFLLQCMKVKSESEVAQSCPLLVTPWTAAHQAPLSMGPSRQEYWSGVPLPSPVYPEPHSMKPEKK